MDLKIIDDVLDREFLKDLEYPLTIEKPWFFGYDQDYNETRRLILGLKTPRDSFGDVEKYLLSRIESQGIDTRRISRCYYNCFRKGDAPRYHTDPFGHTYMFYLNKEWSKLWGAPTKFKKEKYHIPKLIFPKPGRLVIFDAKIWHKGTAPNIFMPNINAGRLSIAFHEH